MSKRKSLSFEKKCLIISAVSQGNKKKKDIAEEFGISPTTLSTILKNKDKIQESSSSGILKKFKKARSCEYPDVNEAMIKWITVARHKNIPLSGPLIREKAVEFAESLGHSDFVASAGWLDKFKRRHNIVGKVVCGESGSIDIQTRDDWIQNILPSLIQEYDKNDIFNADETGLFFKCLPSRTLAFRNEKCVGGKKSKERITVMVGSNWSGTEKLRLLVIGKSKNPRCFKGLQNLEVDYENNSKSWMTSELYEKWLLKLDNKFAAQKRKILLFIDNCPAHPKSAQSKLTNIKIVYFPPNMTSSLQPMDQGIIQNLKHHYRKRILKKVLCYSEKEAPMSISLLDGIRDLSKAWSSDVKKETISNCFKKAGFGEGIELPVDIEDENLPLADLWSAYVEDNNIEDVTIEDYINVDNETFTMECPSDEDILQSILSNQYGLNDSENDDSDADEEKNELPTFSQLHSSFNTIRTLMESRNNVPDEIFSFLNRCEDFADEEKLKSLRQTRLTSFFHIK